MIGMGLDKNSRCQELRNTHRRAFPVWTLNIVLAHGQVHTAEMQNKYFFILSFKLCSNCLWGIRPLQSPINQHFAESPRQQYSHILKPCLRSKDQCHIEYRWLPCWGSDSHCFFSVHLVSDHVVGLVIAVVISAAFRSFDQLIVPIMD